MKRVLDLSGFVYSGKSAVSDLLREVEGFSVPPAAEEFDLLRMPGGLVDLKHAVIDWSPARANAAFHRFEQVARVAGRVLPLHRKFFQNGLAYQARYPNYWQALESFLVGICLLRWDTPWPYENLTDNPWQTLWRRLSEKAGFLKLRDFRLIDREQFLPQAQAFTRELLWSGVSGDRVHTVVVHNSLEAFDPGRNLDLYGDAKAIVVDRDPRDIYANAHAIDLAAEFGRKDRGNRYLNICCGHDVHLFIKRFNAYRMNVRASAAVLRLRFEELVQEYDVTVGAIFEFLGVERAEHVARLQRFRPELSRKSIDMWKQERFRKYWSDCELIGSQCHAA